MSFKLGKLVLFSFVVCLGFDPPHGYVGAILSYHVRWLRLFEEETRAAEAAVSQKPREGIICQVVAVFYRGQMCKVVARRPDRDFTIEEQG